MRVIYKGEARDIPRQHARVLIALGLAAEERAADEEVVEALQEKAAPEEEISPRTGKPKRQYKRRDMTAEG